MDVNVRSFPRTYEIDTNDFDNELNALLDRLLDSRVARNKSQPADLKGISASFCKGVLSLEISKKAIA